MSRKFKIATVAILATLTFATTAFAGIFDIVGAVVGGVLGVQTTASQEQLENFHKSYLEKSAARILETGSVDTAFNEMVEEQKKIGCTVKVIEPDTYHKIAEISGGGLPVSVKCLVNKKTQTVTISYLKSDGMPTGNVLTKKYELPEGVSHDAVTNDNNTVSPANNTTEDKNLQQDAKSKTENANNDIASKPAQETRPQDSDPFREGAICADGKLKIIKGFQYSNVAGSGVLEIWCTVKNVSPRNINRIYAPVKVKDKDGTTVGNGSCGYEFTLAPGETAIAKGTAVVQTREFNGIKVLITSIKAY